MTPCILQLTCANTDEAQKVAQSLLELRLVACVKTLPLTSQFLWKGAIDTNNEVLLLMESVEELFERIEAEVAKLHSYETFVLTSTTVSNINKKAHTWLTESVQK